MLRYFKSISIFKLDLGSNLKGPVQNKPSMEGGIKIKDEFIKKYERLTGRFIRKYGDIGKLKFYEDNNINGNEFHIYNDDKIYEIEATLDDLQKEAIDYLTETIQMIEQGEVEEDIEYSNMMKDISYTNMSEDVRRPDISMPKDEYIEAIVNRRRSM